jgi:hypothetical protein
VERFEGGQRSVADDKRSEKSSTVTCVEVEKKIDQRIWDNRRISIDD